MQMFDFGDKKDKKEKKENNKKKDKNFWEKKRYEATNEYFSKVSEKGFHKDEFNSGIYTEPDLTCENIEFYKCKEDGSVVVVFNDVKKIISQNTKTVHNVDKNIIVHLSKQTIEDYQKSNKSFEKAVYDKIQQMDKIFSNLITKTDLVKKMPENKVQKLGTNQKYDVYDLTPKEILITDDAIYQPTGRKSFYKIADLDKLEKLDKKVEFFYVLKDKKFNYKLDDFLDEKKIKEAEGNLKKTLLELGKLKIEYNINDFLDDKKIVDTINKFYDNGKTKKLTVKEKKNELYWDSLKRAICRVNESSEFIKIDLSEREVKKFSSEEETNICYTNIAGKYVNIDKLISSYNKDKNKNLKQASTENEKLFEKENKEIKNDGKKPLISNNEKLKSGIKIKVK